MTKHLFGRALLLAAGLLASATAAQATNNYDYAKDEYVIIRDGLSPDRWRSLATHGDGEFGYGNFHVWLMAEPSHRRLVALGGIDSNNNLDTGADAYHATWSPDSHHVAVVWRRERHVAELHIYAIRGHRSRLIAGPTLFKDVTSRDVERSNFMRSGNTEITWLSAKRFVLKEYRGLVGEPGFLKALGRFGTLGERRDDGKVVMEFSAEAICQLLPGHRYRIVDIKPGEPAP